MSDEWTEVTRSDAFQPDVEDSSGEGTSTLPIILI
jgi:hypothetical protein